MGLSYPSPVPGDVKESIVRKMMTSMALVALVVGGCATYNSSVNTSNIDYERIARVENAARQYGVSVYWLNYPTKSSASVN